MCVYIHICVCMNVCAYAYVCIYIVLVGGGQTEVRPLS